MRTDAPVILCEPSNKFINPLSCLVILVLKKRKNLTNFYKVIISAPHCLLFFWMTFPKIVESTFLNKM